MTFWAVDSQGTKTSSHVAIIIVNYRTPELTIACLRSLKAERSAIDGIRVLVVDGGSADGSDHILASAISRPEFKYWVELVKLPVNGGFGWANNQAIRRLIDDPNSPEYIHLLNPDTQIEAGAVLFLAQYLHSHPQVAAVGSQLLEMDGSWTGSAFTFPTIRGEFSRGARTGVIDKLLRVPPVAVKTSSAMEVDWATGASVMLRLTALREVGLFDEGFFLYHEEIELMWRLRKAEWAIATEPRSRVRHVGGGSTGVHDRGTNDSAKPQKPPYWYRSRSRYFGLTRGRATVLLAYFAWILGYSLWKIRRLVNLAPNARPVAHEMRDHLLHAFPRRDDVFPAVMPATGTAREKPMWMENKWL